MYTMLAFLALLGAPYIYDISSLRVRHEILNIITKCLSNWWSGSWEIGFEWCYRLTSNKYDVLVWRPPVFPMCT